MNLCQLNEIVRDAICTVVVSAAAISSRYARARKRVRHQIIDPFLTDSVNRQKRKVTNPDRSADGWVGRIANGDIIF